MTHLSDLTAFPVDLLLRRTPPPEWMVLTWTAVGTQLTSPPAPRSQAVTAECTCPIDCIRDHESD